MLHQLKCAGAVLSRPTREVVILPVGVDAERAPRGAEPPIPRTVGNRRSARLAGDREDEAVKPSMLGS